MMETRFITHTNGDRDLGMTAMNPDETVRANTYNLLAALLAAPMPKEMLTLLQKIDAPLENENRPMVIAWQTLKLASQRTTIEAVDDEYHALFIGIGRGELVPYGSWYLTGFLMDRPLANLRRDLLLLGIERREAIHEPEDHVAASCESMSLIINSGDSVAWALQQQFFHEHIAPWMMTFFSDLQQAKSARFYRAVGQFGEQFIELEKHYLAMLA